MASMFVLQIDATLEENQEYHFHIAKFCVIFFVPLKQITKFEVHIPGKHFHVMHTESSASNPRHSLVAGRSESSSRGGQIAALISELHLQFY